VTQDDFTARLEVVPFPSVIVASLREARKQKAGEGHGFTRSELVHGSSALFLARFPPTLFVRLLFLLLLPVLRLF
jgi:hypothetical protein